MNKEIPTVHHSDYNMVNSFETRSLNEDIPLVQENIPNSKSKTKTLYIIISLIILSFLVNCVIYVDIYRQVYDLKSCVSVIQKEQINRTERVYNIDRKKMLKSDFKRWLVDFKRLNDELTIPRL